MSRRAIQDQLDTNLCFGCGSKNPHGLGIKSYWSGDECIATWQPAPHHAAGPPGVLNGGIIATLIDCHAGCTAVANAYRQERRELASVQLASVPAIWYATASLKVDYLRRLPSMRK